MKVFTIVFFALVALAGTSAQDPSPSAAVSLDYSDFEKALARIQDHLKYFDSMLLNLKNAGTIVTNEVTRVTTLSEAVKATGNVIAKLSGFLVSLLVNMITTLVGKVESLLGLGASDIPIGKREVDSLKQTIKAVEDYARNAVSQTQVEQATQTLNVISDLIDEKKKDLGAAVTALINSLTGTVAGLLALVEQIVTAVLSGDFKAIGKAITAALTNLATGLRETVSGTVNTLQSGANTISSILKEVIGKASNLAIALGA